MLISDQDNPIYSQMLNSLKNILNQHRRIINCYLQNMIDKFEVLLQFTPQNKKKSLRKSTFE